MLQDILESNGMPTDLAFRSTASCPATPFFLQEDFIRKYGAYANIPDEHMAELIELAARILKSTDLKRLAWHCYCIYSAADVATFKSFPAGIDVLGDDSGRFFVLIMLANVRVIEDRARRENFPVEYAHGYAQRISTMALGRQLNQDRPWGVSGNAMGFALNFKCQAMFHIGRFDFIPLQVRHSLLPILYTNGTDIVGLCQDGQMVRDNDELAPREELCARRTRLVVDGDTVTGTPVDFTRALVRHEETTLDLNEWHAIISPDDWTIDFHIPGGGGMTPEKCDASFKEAWSFFKSYYPDLDFKLIWSNSWIFSPDWLDYIPDSNMAKLIRRGRIYPVVSTGKDGLAHIFMRDDDDFGSYKVRTSLQATVLKCLRERKFLRRCGWFILPEEI